MISDHGLVRAKNVGVTFDGEVCALGALDLEIRAGEFVSIVGPSGCGKSTVLRLVSGLLRPSAGRLTVAGHEPLVARRQAIRMALVFQDATLLPWRTARDNVALPLELAGWSRVRRSEAAASVLQTVGLADFADRYPDQLSGGMRMRVSLARALTVEPDLMLLDEPFAALDDITRQSLNDELHRLWHERHWTGVFVTHNVAEAVYLSQRILVMSPRPGRVVAEVAVPFECPRHPDLRARGEFAALCGEVTARLREATQ